MVLKEDPCMKQRSWGVFSRDGLPRQLLQGGYIMNTDNIDGPGVHWIALWMDSDRLEFMDSFGHSPEYYGWSFNVPTLRNAVQFQSDQSITCGAYCLYFLYYRCRGFSMKSILENFSSDRTANDYTVTRFLHAL